MRKHDPRKVYQPIEGTYAERVADYWAFLRQVYHMTASQAFTMAREAT